MTSPENADLDRQARLKSVLAATPGCATMPSSPTTFARTSTSPACSRRAHAGYLSPPGTTSLLRSS
jgi:hypothetical protein